MKNTLRLMALIYICPLLFAEVDSADKQRQDILGLVQLCVSQVIESANANKGVVHIGLYEAHPKPTIHDYNTGTIEDLDPLHRWWLDPQSKPSNRKSYVTMRLMQSIYSECPEFINAPKMSSAGGAFSDPTKRLTFDGLSFKLYVIIFSGGQRNENYVIKPLREFDSVIGVRQPGINPELPGLPRIINLELIAEFKAALTTALSGRTSGKGKVPSQ